MLTKCDLKVIVSWSKNIRLISEENESRHITLFKVGALRLSPEVALDPPLVSELSDEREATHGIP
jgi:hypothetical protein